VCGVGVFGHATVNASQPERIRAVHLEIWENRRAIRPALALIVVNGTNKWAEFAQMTVTEREIGTQQQGSGQDD